VFLKCLNFFFGGETKKQHWYLSHRNAKCRHLKKLTRIWTLRQVFICLRPRTPHSPPLTHRMYTHIQYTYSQREGGRELNQREVERANRGEYRSQSWAETWKYQRDLMYARNWLSPVYKLCWHLPRNPFTGQFFYMTDILQWLLWVLFFYDKTSQQQQSKTFWTDCNLSSAALILDSKQIVNMTRIFVFFVCFSLNHMGCANIMKHAI